MMNKLSLDERRRRRKAEQQRQLFEEAKRAEEEFHAEKAAAVAAAASSPVVLPEHFRPPKKTKLQEEQASIVENKNNEVEDRVAGCWNHTRQKPAAEVCKKTDTKGGSGLFASSSSSRGLLDDDDDSSLVQEKNTINFSHASSSSPQSSLSMSSPMTKLTNAAAAAAAKNNNNHYHYHNSSLPPVVKMTARTQIRVGKRRHASSGSLSLSLVSVSEQKKAPPGVPRSNNTDKNAAAVLATAALVNVQKNDSVVGKREEEVARSSASLMDETEQQQQQHPQQELDSVDDNNYNKVLTTTTGNGGGRVDAYNRNEQARKKQNEQQPIIKSSSSSSRRRRRLRRSYSNDSSSSDDSLPNNWAIFQQMVADAAAAAAIRNGKQQQQQSALSSSRRDDDDDDDATVAATVAAQEEKVVVPQHRQEQEQQDSSSWSTIKKKTAQSPSMSFATPTSNSTRRMNKNGEDESPRSTLRDPTSQVANASHGGDDGGGNAPNSKGLLLEKQETKKFNGNKNTAAALRSRSYSSSSSSSSDDSLPDNLAIFQEMQAKAAAAAKGTSSAAAPATVVHRNSSVATSPRKKHAVVQRRQENEDAGLRTNAESRHVMPSTRNDKRLLENHDHVTAENGDGNAAVATTIKGGGAEKTARLPPEQKKKWALRSRSYSDSSDDSLPNNLAIFQQMQAALKAKENDTIAAAGSRNGERAPSPAKNDSHYDYESNNNNNNRQNDPISTKTSMQEEDNQAKTSTDPTASEIGAQEENQVAPFLDSIQTLSSKGSTATTTTTTLHQSTARNPLARMKEEARQELTMRTLAPAFNEDYARQLDDDDDDDDVMPVANDDSSTSSSENTKKKKKKKKKRSSAKGDFTWNSMRISVDHLESIEGRDADELAKELRPEFRESQVLFEAHPLEPIQLEVETGDGKFHEYEVPASIARYLYDFQQDGIRFMFNAIMIHRGAILGDDMGLGKTIQTIGLLAALFRKTGTGTDLIELHRRARMAEFFKHEVEEAKQEALESGELYRPVAQTTAPSSELEWGPVLILAPSSVLEAWVKAFKVWGYFSVALYENDKRKAILENVRLGSVEILIASHNRIQADGHATSLREIPWKLVIIDEFHKMKNVNSSLAKNLRLLRDAHDDTVLIGLTGTMMQNDHKELWNQFDIISKGFLSSWEEFRDEISRPIMISRTKDANPHAIQRGNTKSEELSSRMYEIYLVRKKEVVLKDRLPEKDERIVFCELSTLQKKIYKYVLKQPDFKLLKQYYIPCDCGINQKFFQDLQQLSSLEERIEYQRRNKNKIVNKARCCYTFPETYRGSGEIDPRAVMWRRQHEDGQKCDKCPSCVCLPAMTILCKLSSHIGLIQPRFHPDACATNSAEWKDATKKLELAKMLIPKEVIGRGEDQLPSYILEDSVMDDHFSLSGKMRVLARLLKAIDKQGGRVLVFSAFKQSLDLIQNYVITSGYSFLRMDGDTPTHKRQDLADKFNASQDILLFLLSTKAMGLGINLTGANFVIIFDVEWNPSWDSQAQDRSYRLGQKQDVTVFRLVSRGTLEEQKYLRQVYKTQLKNETMVDIDDPERCKAARLFRGVAKDKTRRGELFGLSNLLRYEDGTLMKYGAEAKEARQFECGGIYNMKSVMAAAKKTVADDDDDLDYEAITSGVADLAKRSEKKEDEKGGNESDDSDDCSMMGAESQFVVDMCGNDDAGTAFIASNAVVTAADSVASLAQNGATPAAGKYGNGDIVADTVPSLAIMQDATTTTGADDDEDVVSRAANVAVKPEKG